MDKLSWAVCDREMSAHPATMEMHFKARLMTIFNAFLRMKKNLLMASAFLAVVACSREPVVPEEPVTEQTGSIQVSLVAGEPETRTELGYTDNKLKPFWSTGDNINVIRIPDPNDDEDDYEWIEEDEGEGGYYNYHLFESDLTQSSLSAVFTGEVDNEGQYRAFYPDRVEGVDRWGDPVIDGPMLDEEFNALRFTIPTVQYPSSTSFDKRADLLVSAPFEIQNHGQSTLGAATSDIPISFTRPNAIVKVVFNVSGTLRNKLENQKVRKVSFNSFGGGLGPEGGEMMMSAPQTRAFVLDNDEDEVGLTGDVLYGIPYVTHDETYNCNETDSYQFHPWRGSNSSVFAEYTDETAFDILDSDAAVYFIVYPSILKNVEDEGSFNGGLPIRIETDGYVITRDVRLPSSGIALQPSVVTTLKINLTEDNLIEFEKKGICIDQEEMVLMPGDGRFVDIEPMGMYFPRDVIDDNDDFQEYFAVTPADFSLRYVEYGEIDDCSSYAGTECISHLYLSADENVTPGEHEVTITYDGKYSTTCSVTVITSSAPIVFVDAAVKAICVDAWGSNGVLTEYQASKVTSLENPDTYQSYFKGNTDIEFFDEFEFFTGLTGLDSYAFAGCSNLKRIKLPKNITLIEDPGYGSGCAFMNCTSLETVDLSECTVLEGIGEHAFENCTSLTTFTLPASVTFISPDAFRYCTNLATFIIPADSRLEDIHGNSYYDYENYSNEHGAFYGCHALESIALPPTLRRIKEFAFKNCISLSSIVIPDGVLEIGSYAFEDCRAMESISIPGSIHSISVGAFRDCENLSEVILHEGLTTIDRFAFYNCKGLHEIEFPASLTTIGYSQYENYVFGGVEFRSGTDNLGNVYHGVKFKGSTPPRVLRADTVISGKHWDASANDGEGGWVNGVNIYVLSGSKAAYESNSQITNNGQNPIIEY